ncbi:MAG: hypothetical protein COV71_04800 [Candidatus Omnitrophica bacterium CG11_big_fil_rev_8_21_14_0_20_41_12]|nr:MAG: hypothetical protein COV71_04800 [Candidatus Omnitrophica bacterium CG11_big_fil_rev_8_21_14_0_20_41_12]
MRDLLFKNLTSSERGRKIIASSEIADKEGVHSVVRRHFTYLVKQIQSKDALRPKPYLFVLKEKKSKANREHFFCKVKGSLIAENGGKLLLILFSHTLNVELTVSAKLSGQTG